MESGARSDVGGVPRELPRGPHRLTREQVGASQRERILRAMVAAAGERGYAQTPVAEVIARAHVSRKAFYEHFPNREACFLEASDRVIDAAVDLVASTYDASSSGQLGAAEEAIGAVFARGMGNPSAVRLVLVELAALGSAGIARREQLIAAYEQLLNESAGFFPADTASPILRAIVGGLAEVIHARAFAREAALSPTLVADLMTWITSYRPVPNSIAAPPLSARPPMASMGGRAPGTLAPSRISGGRRRPGNGSHSYIVHNQRERILDAVASLSAAEGYAAFTVGAVGERAAVSLETFYEHFAGKEDAFLVAYELGHSRSIALVEDACLTAPAGPASVKAGIAALFHFLASEPAFAHLALVDSPVATTSTAARARRGLAAYGEVLLQTLEEAGTSPPSPLVLDAIVGGVFELCMSHSLHKRTLELPALVAPATYFVLAPVVGAQAAARIATDPLDAPVA